MILLLGGIQGGLGLMLANNSRNGKIAWGVIAGSVGLIYVAVVAVNLRKGNNRGEGEKAGGRKAATGTETGDGPSP